jgi:hypothetical protein
LRRRQQISRADVAEAEELMSPRVDPVAEGEDRLAAFLTGIDDAEDRGGALCGGEAAAAAVGPRAFSTDASETFTVGKGWKSLRAEKDKAALAMATAGAARKSEYRCSHPSVLEQSGVPANSLKGER